MGPLEVTVDGIDQLVFGYDEGHRLLRGSRRVPSTALVTLLGATDARIERVGERLVTGFPLHQIECYALCFTWKAPERPRPGAVWSHVLLARREHFEMPGAVGVLRALARRPEPGELGQYGMRLGFVGGTTAGEVASRSVTAAVVEAVYGDAGPIVVHDDLGEAERALFAIWEAQWPELRWHFEFRTRESARMSPSDGVVVARRVHGMMRHGESAPRAAWTAKLAAAIATGQMSRVRRFVEVFGPADVPEVGTVGWLTRLHYDIELGNSIAVRKALETRYDARRTGHELKEQLFGRSVGQWWTLEEGARLSAVLGTHRDAWDLEALAFERRLRDWIRGHGLESLIGDLKRVPLESVRGALLNALVCSGKVSDLAPLVRICPEVAGRWLVEMPRVGREPDAWLGLEQGQVEAVWSAVGAPDSRSLLAATVAGHGDVAIAVLGFGAALASAARARDLAAATILVEGNRWSLAVEVSEESAEVALLLGAIADGREVPGLIDALEARRYDVDEMWLKAAVNALVGTEAATGKVLEVAFGPLHHSIVDDRLPAGCWKSLEHVLPEAREPAWRLSRLLVKIAKEEGWRQKKYRRALRGVGQYTSRLYRELSEQDTWFGGVRNFIDVF